MTKAKCIINVFQDPFNFVDIDEDKLRDKINELGIDKLEHVAFPFKKAPASSENYNPEGCDPVDILVFTKVLLEIFNKNNPCRENSISITKIEEAIMWQEKRTANRIKQGIEGFDISKS